MLLGNFKKWPVRVLKIYSKFLEHKIIDFVVFETHGELKSLA